MQDGSYVDPSAELGRDVKIGRFCVIEAGVVLGDGATIEDHTTIRAGARIGSRTKIGIHSVVGAEALIGADCSFTAYCEVRAKCQLGDRVSMGSRCTLSAGTVVGDDVIIKYGFVATDTPVLAESHNKAVCHLRSGSRYGANVTIMPGVTVGIGSEIGACSQVRKDVPDGQVWYGSPAKFHREAEV